MKTKELEKTIMTRIASQLKGFKTKLAETAFVRKYDEGLQKIKLITLDRYDHWEVTPYIYVRNNAIEELVSSLTANEIKEMITIGNDFSRIVSGQDEPEKKIHYIIKTYEDIDRTIESISNLVNTVGENYFEKFKTLEAIDETLNKNPAEKTLDCEVNPSRCIRGSIVAKLVSNPRIPELIQVYTPRMQEVNDRDKNAFPKVVEWARLSE